MEKPESKLNLGIFFLSLIALVWINNAYIPLWNADEAAYAGMAKTMLDSGNGLVQDFFMSDVHRKPPLHLWLIALSYQIFGVNEWAVRFPSSLSILGGAWLIFSWMRSRFDQYTGQVAAGIFVSNFLILAMAKVAFVDAHLVFCVILLGISYFKISFEEFKVSDVVFYWLAIALGLLIKGPQIAVFAGLLFIGTFIIHRSWRPLLNIKPYIGLPLAVVPLLIWGYLSYQNDGGKMISWMWDWYVLKRIKGEAVFAQTGPPGYYLANIIAAFAPFFVGFSLIIKRIWKRGWSEDKWWAYTLIWVLSGWLIYEIIPSKLPTYTIAAYPALSILIAYELTKVDLTAWKSLWMRLGIFIQMLLVAGISMALVYFVQAQFGFWGLLLAILAGLTILTTSIIYVLQLESDKFKRAGITLVWGNVLFAYLLLLPVMNNIIPIFECPKEVASSIQLDVKRSDNILLVKEDVHMVSLPFYLSREAELTQFRDRNESIQSANSIDYRAVIADSTFSQSLIEKYEPRDTFSCFDMNTGSNNQYIVFLLR